MLELIVPDMTCGHCTKAIAQAVGGIDGNATLDFDLSNHRVRVSSERNAADIRAAIEQAGYAVKDLEAGYGKRASCCGSCHT